jgi:hypothetical protein
MAVGDANTLDRVPSLAVRAAPPRRHVVEGDAGEEPQNPVRRTSARTDGRSRRNPGRCTTPAGTPANESVAPADTLFLHSPAPFCGSAF